MAGQDPEKIKMGKLEGQQDRPVGGTAILAIDPEGGEAVHFKDVQMNDVSGATVYLAANGDLERSICLGELKQTSGTFKQPIPFGTDTTPYNTVIIQDGESQESLAFVRL